MIAQITNQATYIFTQTGIGLGSVIAVVCSLSLHEKLVNHDKR